MRSFEHTQAFAVLSAFTPSQQEAFHVDSDEVDFAKAFERVAQACGTKARIGFKFAMYLAAFSPFWLAGRFRTFRSLPLTERGQLIERLVHHRFWIIRELMVMLKVAATMAVFTSEVVRARSNYDRKPDSFAPVARLQKSKRAVVRAQARPSTPSKSTHISVHPAAAGGLS